MGSKASGLFGVDGEEIALTDVEVSASLRDLLAEVSITQSYVNKEKTNIEAVYTFPLPLDAVLLGMNVSIGNRLLKGVVIEKQEAQDGYEKALEEGDAAVMLEETEPGLYTMNVGNLLPGEKASISLSYSMIYRWSGDQLRFMLPTTISPRYGDSPHSPHQIPESSLTVENNFSLKVEVYGSLKRAQFVCPSHKVNLSNNVENTVISLDAEKASMDRDFVLNIKAPNNQRSFVLSGVDGAGVAAIASFQPFFPGLRQPKPLNLAIVVDCSGSMLGDSIAQAKQALDSILEGLQSHDKISIVAFGSTTNVFSKKLLPCTAENIKKAKSFSGELDANLGGTKIDLALKDTYTVIGEGEAADILLITDGGVANWSSVVTKAQSSGHRIFTVGVGSSVAEAFVRELASKTGGECELVAPCEGMAEKVVRHFERMRAPKAKRTEIYWPDGAKSVTPEKIGAVFEGDTIIATAQFKSLKKAGLVVLEVETEAGEISKQELQINVVEQSEDAESFSSIARLAASYRLKGAKKKQGLATALKYQLVSPWSNYLVISEREDEKKVYELPALRKVPQTLSAGWGGSGSMRRSMSNLSVSFCAMPSFAPKFESNELENVRRVPPYLQRFVEIVNNQPERLMTSNLLSLLDESSLSSRYKDVFNFAKRIGIDENFSAAVIVGDLLKMVDEYLSGRARLFSEKFISELNRTLDFMNDLSKRSEDLCIALNSQISRNVFENNSFREMTDAAKRLQEFRRLLELSRGVTRHEICLPINPVVRC